MRRLAEAGLDEIRFHPPLELWGDMHGTEWEDILYIAREEGLTPAFEIPGIRAEPEFLDFLDEGAAEFCNINEFEMSDGNYRRMQEKGYELQDGHMSAVDGSKEAILDEMGDHERVYFCTSVFKDAAQHRNRLKRMARNLRRPFDDVTDDGTLVYGKAWTSEPVWNPRRPRGVLHRQVRARRTRLVAARGDGRRRRRRDGRNRRAVPDLRRHGRRADAAVERC